MRFRISVGSSPVVSMPPSRSNRVTHPVRNWKVRSPGGRLNGRKPKRISGWPGIIGRQLPGSPRRGIASASGRTRPGRESGRAGLYCNDCTEQEVEREALARAGGPENQGVSRRRRRTGRNGTGFASAFGSVVSVGASRWALRADAAGRAEQGRKRGGRAGGHQNLSQLPGSGLPRHPVEPLRELPVALPDQLGVIGGEDAPQIAIQALNLGEIAMQGDREAQIPIGNAVAFQARPAPWRAGPTPRWPRCPPSPPRCLRFPGRETSWSTAAKNSAFARS